MKHEYINGRYWREPIFRHAFSIESHRFFCAVLYEDPAAILIPPPAEDNRLLACAKPFRWEVWLSLMSFAIILPAVLCQSLRILWTSTNSDETTRTRPPILVKKYIFVLGVLVGQCKYNYLFAFRIYIVKCI